MSNAKPSKKATVKSAKTTKTAKAAAKPIAAPAKAVEQRPLIGLSVIVERDGKVLMAKRRTAHGAGTWEIQGGHLEFGESFEEGVLREVKEEIGVDVLLGGIISISNDRVYGKHYVSLGFHTVLASGEPLIQDPQKTERLMWVDPHALPEPVFAPSRHTIENWLSGIMYRPSDPVE